MELLEAAALTPSDAVRLPERVNYLREAIQCATLAQVGSYRSHCGCGVLWCVLFCMWVGCCLLRLAWVG